jgi:hypothetical protein
MSCVTCHGPAVPGHNICGGCAITKAGPCSRCGQIGAKGFLCIKACGGSVPGYGATHGTTVSGVCIVCGFPTDVPDENLCPTHSVDPAVSAVCPDCAWRGAAGYECVTQTASPCDQKPYGTRAILTKLPKPAPRIVTWGPFDLGFPAPAPKVRLANPACTACGIELSAYLDAWYGEPDHSDARKCDPCRRGVARGA